MKCIPTIFEEIAFEKKKTIKVNKKTAKMGQYNHTLENCKEIRKLVYLFVIGGTSKHHTQASKSKFLLYCLSTLIASTEN